MKYALVFTAVAALATPAWAEEVGVGIGVGSGAAQRGYKVIVPIDCLSSEEAYMEQYATWHLFKGGPAVVTSQVTLTRSTMVKF